MMAPFLSQQAEYCALGWMITQHASLFEREGKPIENRKAWMKMERTQREEVSVWLSVNDLRRFLCLGGDFLHHCGIPHKFTTESSGLSVYDSPSCTIRLTSFAGQHLSDAYLFLSCIIQRQSIARMTDPAIITISS